jgi:hypothetical protein
VSLLAAALLLAQAAAPPAAWREGDWLEVHRDPSAALAIDRRVTHRDGARVRTRLRADFPELHRGVRWGVASIELDCDARTIRTLEATEYGPDGAVSGSTDGPETEPRPAGGPMSIYFAICRQAGWTGSEAAGAAQ